MRVPARRLRGFVDALLGQRVRELSFDLGIDSDFGRNFDDLFHGATPNEKARDLSGTGYGFCGGNLAFHTRLSTNFGCCQYLQWLYLQYHSRIHSSQ